MRREIDGIKTCIGFRSFIEGDDAFIDWIVYDVLILIDFYEIGVIGKDFADIFSDDMRKNIQSLVSGKTDSR